MGTLTSLLNLSFSALQADQSALNVTANNVANQNTVGYTRETVTFENDAVTLNSGSSGGVSTTAPTSVRDRVLEQRVQQQTQAQGQSGAIDAALQQVQSVFGVTSTATSASTTALGSATDGFFSSLSQLASNPSDTATRQGVLSAATTLASALNSASSQLGQITTGLNQQATSIVGQVNTLTATIAKLNGEIASTSPNGDAGALEDARQSAIAQLSQYVGLDQVTTEQNGITLATTNGSVLVGGSTSYALTTSQVGGVTHIFAGGDDITASLTGGQLGGVINARDQQIPAFSQALDNLAYGIATQVNQQNEAGLDGNGNAGQAIFTISATAAGAAGAIAVATTDPQAIAAAGVGQGSSGNVNAQALAGLATANIVGGSSASSFYASLLSSVGTAAAAASTDDTAQQSALTQITSQRDSLSAVSLDQEASNLTQYQRSYQAAAQVFSITNAVMASALNLGEQTTVT